MANFKITRERELKARINELMVEFFSEDLHDEELDRLIELFREYPELISTEGT